jgi:hypothetical protein
VWCNRKRLKIFDWLRRAVTVGVERVKVWNCERTPRPQQCDDTERCSTRSVKDLDYSLPRRRPSSSGPIVRILRCLVGLFHACEDGLNPMIYVPRYMGDFYDFLRQGFFVLLWNRIFVSSYAITFRGAIFFQGIVYSYVIIKQP